MKTRGRASALLALLLALCSCGQAVNTAANSAAAKSQAEALADQYFAFARSEDWAGAEGLYHPRFFEAIPLETWRRILPNVDRELGKLQSCTQETWHVSKKAGTSFVGTIVTLNYKCQHERYESAVAFTIGRASDESEYRIYGQNFNSIGFLIE